MNTFKNSLCITSNADEDIHDHESGISATIITGSNVSTDTLNAHDARIKHVYAEDTHTDIFTANGISFKPYKYSVTPAITFNNNYFVFEFNPTAKTFTFGINTNADFSTTTTDELKINVWSSFYLGNSGSPGLNLQAIYNKSSNEYRVGRYGSESTTPISNTTFSYNGVEGYWYTSNDCSKIIVYHPNYAFPITVESVSSDINSIKPTASLSTSPSSSINVNFNAELVQGNVSIGEENISDASKRISISTDDTNSTIFKTPKLQTSAFQLASTPITATKISMDDPDSLNVYQLSRNGHKHVINDVEGLSDTLEDVSHKGHNHAISDITDLQTTINSKLNTSEFNKLNSVIKTYRIRNDWRAHNVHNPIAYVNIGYIKNNFTAYKGFMAKFELNIAASNNSEKTVFESSVVCIGHVMEGTPSTNTTIGISSCYQIIGDINRKLGLGLVDINGDNTVYGIEVLASGYNGYYRANLNITCEMDTKIKLYTDTACTTEKNISTTIGGMAKLDDYTKYQSYALADYPYALKEHTHNSSDITFNSNIIFTDSGTNTREIRFIAGENDWGRIAVGATETNKGWLEIATADDVNEPIYVRQYRYNSNNIYNLAEREAVLLDASGNTSFPGTLTASNVKADNETRLVATETALAAKANASHTHAIADVEGLEDALANAQSNDMLNYVPSNRVNCSNWFVYINGYYWTGSWREDGVYSKSSDGINWSEIGNILGNYAKNVHLANGVMFNVNESTTYVYCIDGENFIKKTVENAANYINYYIQYGNGIYATCTHSEIIYGTEYDNITNVITTPAGGRNQIVFIGPKEDGVFFIKQYDRDDISPYMYTSKDCINWKQCLLPVNGGHKCENTICYLSGYYYVIYSYIYKTIYRSQDGENFEEVYKFSDLPNAYMMKTINNGIIVIPESGDTLIGTQNGTDWIYIKLPFTYTEIRCSDKTLNGYDLKDGEENVFILSLKDSKTGLWRIFHTTDGISFIEDKSDFIFHDAGLFTWCNNQFLSPCVISSRDGTITNESKLLHCRFISDWFRIIATKDQDRITALEELSHEPYDDSEVRTLINTKANSTHTHSITDVNDLQSTLNGKASTDHTHSNFTNEITFRKKLTFKDDSKIEFHMSDAEYIEHNSYASIVNKWSIASEELFGWKKIYGKKITCDELIIDTTNVEINVSNTIAALQNTTNIQAEQILNKANSTHTHDIADVDGLEDALANAQVDLTPVYTAIDSLKALM